MKAILLLAFVGAAFAAVPQTHPVRDGRIVGGEQTTIDKYPFMASMLTTYVSQFFYMACGGTLITNYVILSAAHCYYGERPNGWRVIVGSTYPTLYNPPYAAQRTPSIFTLHPRFSMATLDNDIALVRLSIPAPLSIHVGVARVPALNYAIPDGSPLTIVGWGALYYGGPTAGVLNHVKVNLINQKLCVDRYKYLKTQPGYEKYYDITDNLLCAGILDVGGKDGCQGDSGGPLVYGSDIVYGITSFGFECADPYYPGVNTRVNKYTDWIVSNS